MNQSKNKVTNRPELENRSYQFEARVEDDPARGKVLIGTPIVYEKETDISGVFREIIHQGALDSCDLTDVRFLVNHDTNRIPLARSRNNNDKSTMKLSVEQVGLRIRVDLDTENNSDARALYSAVERGDISGMSFLFSVRRQEWEGLDTDYPTRHIYELGSVVEVSAVTFPAYKSTDIQARSKNALESARQAAEAAGRRSAEADLELEKLKLNYLYNA